MPGSNGNGKAPTVNSLQDLSRLHAAEMAGRPASRDEMVRRALTAQLTNNLGPTDLVRGNLLNVLLDGPRDIDSECGYPPWLTPDHYRFMYDREGVARRVVDCEPEETWAMDPELFEDDDPQKETTFEGAWNELLAEHNFWHYLERADVLSGIGQFGILLLMIDDGRDLREPVEGVNDDGTFEPGTQHTLLKVRVFDETVVFVKVREIDINNPRYSLPKIYTVQFRDYPNWGVQAGEIIARDIHWSRVVHVADNRKMSEVYGIPRMQPVYNRLYDLRKIYSASGEAFWKGAFPGIAFEVNPEVADQGVELDTKSLKEEMERFQNGTQRYLAITGVTAHSLPPEIVDPMGTAETHLKAIAIAKDIPYRVLFGSEEAVLAGNQDSRKWNKKIARRQTKYVNPMLIKPFVDRLIGMGILPPPKQPYTIEWPDLNAPTDEDKANIASLETQAMAAYVQGGVSSLMAPREYLTHVLEYDPGEADAILEASSEFAGDEDEPLSIAGQAAMQMEQMEAEAALAPPAAGAKSAAKGGKKGKKKQNTRPTRNADLVGNAFETAEPENEVERNLVAAGHDLRPGGQGHWVLPGGKGLSPSNKRGIVNHYEAFEDAGFGPVRGGGTEANNALLAKGWLRRWPGRLTYQTKGLPDEHVRQIEGDLDRESGYTSDPSNTHAYVGIVRPDGSGEDTHQFTLADYHDAGSNLRKVIARKKDVTRDDTPRRVLPDHAPVANSWNTEPPEEYFAIGHPEHGREPNAHLWAFHEGKIHLASPVDAEGHFMDHGYAFAPEELHTYGRIDHDQKKISMLGDERRSSYASRLLSKQYPGYTIHHFGPAGADRLVENSTSDSGGDSKGMTDNAKWESGWKISDAPHPAEQILKNPDKPTLQAFLDTVHAHNEARNYDYSPLKIVLRGAANADGSVHHWGSSFDHDHSDLKLGDRSLENHLYVRTDGSIVRMGRGGHLEPHPVPGIGSKLKPVRAMVANAPDPVKVVLDNPSKGELQALFDTTAHRYGASGQQQVLRGLLHKTTGHHRWGSAWDYEHGELTKGLSIHKEDLHHLFVHADGEIMDYDGPTPAVPGIGRELHPVKRIVANDETRAKDASSTILHNPDRGSLQALFDTVHHRMEQTGALGPDDVVLRGAVSRGGERHVWGNAVRFEHEKLKDAAHAINPRPELRTHVYASPDGMIWKLGPRMERQPYEIKGVGTHLKPAVTANADVPKKALRDMQDDQNENTTDDLNDISRNPGANPDNGDASWTPNLAREGVKHPVDPEQIMLPSINKEEPEEPEETEI